jgi:hypothetical protein
MNKDDWEKIRVQRVLDYCNEKHGTHIVVQGKADTIYPELKGQLNWDWVCRDTQTKEEIAVEVKKLTNPQKEQEYGAIRKAFTKIETKVNNTRELHGTYLLSSQIQLNQTRIFGEKGNKEKFIDAVVQTVCESAKSMKQKEEKLLTPLIKPRLSFQLPDFTSITLCKISDKGEKIGKGFGTSGIYSINFSEKDLKEFERIIIHANTQLEKSTKKNTMLVLIEEGYGFKDPPAVTMAFSRIQPESYSKIGRVYLISGKEISEILLPNPA